MEVAAKLKFTRLSPQKCRLVCDQVRGLAVGQAVNVLKFSAQKSAGVLLKVLNSAIANAENNFGLDIDQLRVSQVYADAGPTLKRMHARAKGRGNRILKPTCHITVVVSD